MENYSINYFEALGLQPTATKAEIQSAYHRLARKWHPDVHQGESASDIAYAERMFSLINEAYRALMDDAGMYRGQAPAGDGPDAGHADSRAADGGNGGNTDSDSWKSTLADIFRSIQKPLKYVIYLALAALGAWLLFQLVSFLLKAVAIIAVIVLIVFLVMHFV